MNFIGRNYGFDDVTLIPRVISSIESRDDIKIELNLNKDISLTSLIVASPMKDVCDGKVAATMRSLGAFGIINRFFSIEEQVQEYKISNNSPCAIGIDGDAFERFYELRKAGCNTFCIDVANGATLKMKKAIEKISYENEQVGLIVGNVASKECYQWLEQFDKVLGIRCGIAGGSVCSTKNATGVSHGMISAIAECASVRKRTFIIADGGVREPSDYCKAIAAGADLVLLGSAIASTTSSPAEVIEKDGKLYKVYHGSASFDIQKTYRKSPRYIEGKTKLIPFEQESLEDLIRRFSEGLRSSMSYFNARNLEEYRSNVSFCIN